MLGAPISDMTVLIVGRTGPEIVKEEFCALSICGIDKHLVLSTGQLSRMFMNDFVWSSRPRAMLLNLSLVPRTMLRDLRFLCLIEQIQYN